LDVDVGKPEVAIEQQDASSESRQRMGKRDREPGLSDATLA
jgi:hypothetical protein